MSVIWWMQNKPRTTINQNQREGSAIRFGIEREAKLSVKHEYWLKILILHLYHNAKMYHGHSKIKQYRNKTIQCLY